jgi:hypothetical protein
MEDCCKGGALATTPVDVDAALLSTIVASGTIGPVEAASLVVVVVVREARSKGSASSGIVSKDVAPRTGSTGTFEEGTVSDRTGTELEVLDTAVSSRSIVESEAVAPINGSSWIGADGGTRIVILGPFLVECCFSLPMSEEEEEALIT